MKTPPLPPYEVRARSIPDTHYQATDIFLDGERIYSVLGVLTTAEADERVRAYIYPQRVPPVKEFGGKKPGPKPLRVRALDDDLPPEAA